MEHVVFFTGAEGAAQFRRLSSLEDAVRFVEHLRNVEGVDDPRVFSLAEVPLAFKTVYRVEIPGTALPPMPAMPEELAALEPEAPAEPVAEAPAPMPVEEPAAEATSEEQVMAAVPSEPFAEPFVAPAPSNGRRGSGFFAR